MIFGVLERNHEKNVEPDVIKKISELNSSQLGESTIFTQKNFGCYYQRIFKSQYAQKIRPAAVEDGGLVVVFEGKIYNYEELKESLDEDLKKMVNENPATLILCLYKRFGQKFLQKLNGKFAFAIWEASKNNLLLVRDRMGIEPFYYYIDDERVIFSSRIKEILQYPGVRKNLNYQAMYQFLLFNYNPALHTFFSNVSKLRPAYMVNIRDKSVESRSYWNLSFANIIQRDEKEITEKLLDLLRNSVKIRLEPGEDLGVFLSGGMDSSTMTALIHEYFDRQLHTFSYRCKSDSFDESYYAQFMAKHYKTSHHETEYRVNDVLQIEDLVNYMDEPFCDIGINIATYILGKKAAQAVPYIITGDGGDELFAGHPVYEADKMAALVDPIPGIIKAPVLALARMLPDSDKKKNFVVKAKRFATSVGFPKELLSHRWRIYYDEKEIRNLVTPKALQSLNGYQPYSDILQFNREADGPDNLSQSLYSDYNTVVGFYLRRMNLNNKFNLEPRYPMLDHRLIEYCATLPSEVKYKGWSDTKYIFKKTMEGVLPDEIVFRKDKLGHSIPLKNWIRDDKKVKSFVLDYVSEETINKRGFFNPNFVNQMVKEHMTKARNNSHRVWALAVLEMWLQQNYDR